MEDRTVARHTHMPFGKFKGKPLSMLVRAEPAYMKWIAGLPSMDAYPGLSININQHLAKLAGLEGRRAVSRQAEINDRRRVVSTELKPMKVVYPRIKDYWCYNLKGHQTHRAHRTTKEGQLRSERVYGFELYGRREYVYGIQLEGKWYGFVEGTVDAAYAYMKEKKID